MDNTVRLNFDKYDLTYLYAMHERYRKEDENPVVVTGLSYGLDGFDPKLIPGSYNFCMHTQDIYYDYCHVKKILENKRIHPKICIMCWGYYSLFRDLTKSPDYLWRAYKVYKPLFGTIHNAPPVAEEYGLSEIEEMEARIFFSKTNYSYYNNPYIQRVFSPMPGVPINSISQATDEDCVKMARYAAGKHNKMIKYIDTFMENTSIFLKIADILSSIECRVCICIMPYMKEYLDCINPALKSGILDFLERCGYLVEFLDLNDEQIWDKCDFLDLTHLNECGAAKATAYLKDILKL